MSKHQQEDNIIPKNTEGMPEESPKELPEESLKSMPEDSPKELPEDSPKEMPAEIPEEYPEDEPEEYREFELEEYPEDEPEDLPVIKPRKQLSGRRKAIRISLLVFVILLGFFVLGTIAVNCFMVFAEGRHIKELDTWKEDAREGIDCIMVLGCSVNSDQTPSKMLKDRLDAVVELYHASPQKVLVSGDHAGQYYNEVVVMKDYLIQAGIPSEQIFVDHYGVSTYDSVYRAYHVFGVRRITIVTQKYHMYRALYLANAMGMEADGYIAKYVRYTDQVSRDLREVFARDKDFLTAIFKPKVDSPMDPVSLEESGDLTNER